MNVAKITQFRKSVLLLALLLGVAGCGNRTQAGGGHGNMPTGNEPLSVLIPQLKDPDPAKRADAAEGIRVKYLKGDAAVPVIAPLIGNFADPDRKAHEWAAEVFSSMESEAVVPPLIEATKSKTPLVRAMAYNAIGIVPKPVKLARSKEILDTLIAGLKDEDPEARYWVSNGIDKSCVIITDEAIPPIIEALNIDQVRFQAFLCRTLGNLGPRAKAAIPILTKLRADPNPDINAVAHRALGQITKKPESENQEGDEKPKGTPESESKDKPAPEKNGDGAKEAPLKKDTDK